MLPRPRPHRAFGVVRLTVTALLAVHVFISAWLVATIEGTYTEGKPAPTEAHSLVAIDKDQTMIDVEIKKATSFFFYTLERDGDAAHSRRSDEVPLSCKERPQGRRPAASLRGAPGRNPPPVKSAQKSGAKST